MQGSLSSNQDRYFYERMDSYASAYGVFDGHGDKRFSAKAYYYVGTTFHNSCRWTCLFFVSLIAGALGHLVASYVSEQFRSALRNVMKYFVRMMKMTEPDLNKEPSSSMSEHSSTESWLKPTEFDGRPNDNFSKEELKELFQPRALWTSTCISRRKHMNKYIITLFSKIQVGKSNFGQGSVYQARGFHIMLSLCI